MGILVVVFWFVAFVAVATIVGVGEAVGKFADIAGSKKKLGFVKVLIPSTFTLILHCIIVVYKTYHLFHKALLLKRNTFCH